VIEVLIAEAGKLFSGAQARWVGCAPETQTRVYFANHTSHFDFVVLWAVLPRQIRERTRPVAGRDYWERGTLRRFLAGSVFRAVLIEREHVTRDCNPVEPLAAALRAGDSLILFPEGTRRPGPKIAEFKSGLYHLLRAVPGAEGVPVYIENLNRVLPKGEVLPVPFLCSVTFGAPMRLVDGEGKLSFLRRAREAMCVLGET
jgi:1-acyl-sn-glycerol-3-phosphate acyltransferase